MFCEICNECKDIECFIKNNKLYEDCNACREVPENNHSAIKIEISKDKIVITKNYN